KTLQIQPSSLDLTVGAIFRPEVTLGKKGSLSQPLDSWELRPGRTAIVQTKEELHLPDNICAVGFPPAHVSGRGILMTNPGHVDPGYVGRLSFTVINMGRDKFLLSPGLAIVTLLLFQLTERPRYTYSDLFGV